MAGRPARQRVSEGDGMTPAERLSVKKPVRKLKAPTAGVFICRIRALREPLRLTVRDVATAVGMSSAGLHAIENGSDPMLSTALKLAEFFGRDICEIWTKVKK